MKHKKLFSWRTVNGRRGMEIVGPRDLPDKALPARGKITYLGMTDNVNCYLFTPDPNGYWVIPDASDDVEAVTGAYSPCHGLLVASVGAIYRKDSRFYQANEKTCKATPDKRMLIKLGVVDPQSVSITSYSTGSAKPTLGDVFKKQGF